MMKRYWAAALLCLASVHGHAQEAKQPWEEYDKLIKSSEAVTSLGPTLFGDNVNLSNGALSFANADVSIPGNNALPVEVRRSLSVGNRKGYQVNDLPFADWDLDVPRIHGVFRQTGGGGFGTACAVTDPIQARPPSIWTGTEWLGAEDYWQGNQASLPGGGEMLLVRQGVTAPASGGPYYWLTSGFTYFACLAEIKNSPGQGFLALTTDGTKYWFDWAASYHEPPIKGGGKGSTTVLRRKAVLYATRVEDRFGNWVTYDYANAASGPGRLTRIASSDGRAVTLDYNAQGHVSLVTSGDRNWSYVYDYSDPSAASLVAVTLPDQSQWRMAFASFANARIRYEKPHCAPTGSESMCDVVRTCDSPGFITTPDPAPGLITHPSGAMGEFTVQAVRHGRSNVPRVCAGYSEPYNDPNDDNAYYPLNYDAFTLTKKKVTGPGLAAAEWSYGYGANISWAPGTGPVCTTGNCGAPVCTSDSCAGVAVTTVNGPSGDWSRYTFGNSYRYNEGKLLKVERGSGPDSILKTDTTAYELRTSGLPFPTPIGTSPQPRGDGFTSEYLSPQRQRTIVQDGANFNSQVSQFDGMARPLSVANWSSLGNPGRTEVTEYYDDPGKWVMGQPKRQVNAETGLVMSQTDYWPATALPQRTWAFGKAQQYFEYNADGTLARVVDGNNNATMPSEWKRGIPQRVTHADTTFESAVVNNHGWVESKTDENGFTTNYGYDTMGRLASIVHPTGDSTAWNSTNFTFVLSSGPLYGLPAGHWRQTASTGNARVVTFFDALWRPVVKETYDATNINGTLAQIVTRYDARGRTAFVSSPQRNLDPAVYGTWADPAQAANALGTHTVYDALDRAVRVEQDSEHGRLVTITNYLPGFKRQTTNPRGFVTTETFQAYDQPTYDLPWVINAPESVKTVIERDRFGKPLEVARSGPDG